MSPLSIQIEACGMTNLRSKTEEKITNWPKKSAKSDISDERSLVNIHNNIGITGVNHRNWCRPWQEPAKNSIYFYESWWKQCNILSLVPTLVFCRWCLNCSFKSLLTPTSWNMRCNLDVYSNPHACCSQRTAKHPVHCWLTVVLVVQWFGVGLVIERMLVWLPVGALSSQLGQLSLPSLWGR